MISGTIEPLWCTFENFLKRKKKWGLISNTLVISYHLVICPSYNNSHYVILPITMLSNISFTKVVFHSVKENPLTSSVFSNFIFKNVRMLRNLHHALRQSVVSLFQKRRVCAYLLGTTTKHLLCFCDTSWAFHTMMTLPSTFLALKTGTLRSLKASALNSYHVWNFYTVWTVQVFLKPNSITKEN